MAKVIVYSTPTCPWCKKTKEYLSQKGISYTDVDVSSDTAKSKEMVEKSGQMGVPVVDINGTIIVGFNKDKMDAALK